MIEQGSVGITWLRE